MSLAFERHYDMFSTCIHEIMFLMIMIFFNSYLSPHKDKFQIMLKLQARIINNREIVKPGRVSS